MSEHICPNCNKQFSSISNLNAHLRNASYCKRLKDDPNYSIHNKTCKGCSKVFDTTQNYKRHIDVCKEYAVYTITLKYEEEIRQLKTELALYKSAYKNKFGKYGDKLPIFTEESVKNKIKEIRYQSLLLIADNDVNTNFILHISNALKDFIFCTDTSRNKIVIKRENTIFEKMTSSLFIIECFTIARNELISLLSCAIKHCRTLENTLVYEDYTNSMNQLILLNNSVMQIEVSTIVKSLANYIVTVCHTLTNESHIIDK